MKKVTLIAGLLLAVSTATVRAQHEITSYLPDDGEDYRGYCIDRAEFDKGVGYLAIGSRTEGGAHNSIHLMSIIAGDASTHHGQVLYLPDYEDVRAIAVTMVHSNLAAVLLQTTNRGVSHPTIALIDCQDFSNLQLVLTRELSLGEFKFPTSICISGDHNTLYVGGYSLDNFDPTFDTRKRGFVTAVTAENLDIVATRLFDSPQAPNGERDYDMIQRVRWIKDHLYAIGSVNGVDKYDWGTSRSWVAELDASDLHVMQQSAFGNDAWSYSGFQGVDLVPDEKEKGYFYAVSNDYHWHSWCISRLKPSLELVSGGSNFNNTIWYAPPADIKASGVVAHNDGRLSVYGCVGTSPFNPPAGVASYSDGAVPFVASFDPDNTSTGFGFSNLTWYNEGNEPSTVTNLDARYSPYWGLTGDLSYWSIPDFAVAADPNQGQTDLAMMGHVGYDGTYPNFKLAPRLIESDPNGRVDDCIGSGDMTEQVDKALEQHLLLNEGIEVTETTEELRMDDIGADTQPLHFQTRNCSKDKYFRQAQPAVAAAASTGKLALQSLSPNPATDAVTLRWTGTVEAGATLRLDLADLVGRQVGHGTLQARGTASGAFALPQLAPGMYMASLYVNGVLAGQQKLSIR